jgi:uncharacterized protein YegJ (DUF2314 family)
MALRLSLTLASTWLIVLSGCGDPQPPSKFSAESGQPPVVHFADDDPLMTAAIDQARATVDQFIIALEAPTPVQESFAVKVAIKDGDEVEHMWVNPVRHEQGRFIGATNNDPESVTTVKLGDEVVVAKEEVSDWMYIDDGKLVGGYTMRVMRDGLSPEERADFDRSVPFRVE